MAWTRLLAAASTTLGLLAASREFTPYASVKPILDQQREQLPAELESSGQAAWWLSWARRQDKAIRARLQQGELDSMVNLLLYGTSFTGSHGSAWRGRASPSASKTGSCEPGWMIWLRACASPGDNERLIFLQRLLRSQGIDPGSF